MGVAMQSPVETLNEGQKASLALTANTIRGLSMDAIQAANSGHPGLPLGCAELAAYLYGHLLQHNPKNPNWINRDRFVLSAGHGSMLLYASLHLAGFDVSLDDIKNFRKLHSPTAGHPEYRELPGIETTTGPLGQGVATGIGMAFGQKIMEAQFGVERQGLLNSKTYILAGDGCIMEGISAEACSFAGHNNLDNVVLIYDANDICLDGPIDECLSEDTAKRYEAYGWHVQTIDGHDLNDIDNACRAAAAHQGQPCLIIAKTTIGFGAPNMAGTSDVHGKALGDDERRLAKEALNIPQDPEFFVPQEVYDFFAGRAQDGQALEAAWTQTWDAWAAENPEQAKAWRIAESKELTQDMIRAIQNTDCGSGATRQLSSKVLQTIHDVVPFVIGGSADLSCSDSTMMKSGGVVSAKDYSGRNIKYGVREFAMGAIASGLTLQGQIVPYVGTFLMFSDYMRNAIRVAALMKIPVIYQFTHDSVLLGEDGPTHQPVEHLASLRAIPGLIVMRPGDSTEVKAAWVTALQRQQPVALILSRQGVPELEGSSFEGTQKGGYILKKEASDALDFCILTTGSECELALEVAEAKEAEGKSVRVVSIPSFELFNEQSSDYQNEVLGNATQYVSIEAQSTFGWHQYVGRDGICIGVDRFGISAPLADIKEEFGLTLEKVLEKLA